MKPNRFKQICEQGGIPAGHMIMEFATRGLAKILESAGIDFVLLDMEHTGFDNSHIADQVAWLKSTSIAPFVRVPQNLYHFLARVMDAGALGVMVANVESKEEARAVIQAVKYAPLGNRGLGLGTAHNDYIPPDAAAYLRHANENTTVICQIESTKGVKNADEIAATEGVDVLWVGHFDLSQSMGIPAQFHHPDFLAAMRHVVEVTKRHGKRAGIQPGNSEQTQEWLALGFNAISCGLDFAIYRDALKARIGEMRNMCPKP